MIELGELNSHAYFSFHKKGSLHQSLQQQEVASMQVPVKINDPITILNNLMILDH